MVTTDAALRFLAGSRLVVIGASDTRDSFGRTVYTALRDHGHDVAAVHRTAATVAGDPAYPDVASVPGPVAGAVIMVNRDAALAAIRDCARNGIRNVWLFKGVGGPGAASPEAISLCHDLGLDVIEGACPLMFLEPVGLVHRIHRRMRTVRGTVTAA